MTANQLNRSIKPKRRIFSWATLLLLGVAFVIYGFISPPTSADIRLDTGDLRFRYFGIPIVYDKMPEPERSQLLSLARDSAVLKPTWVTVEWFKNGLSAHNFHGMCKGRYERATAWIAEDPRLAKLILEDFATYLRDYSINRETTASNDAFLLLSLATATEDNQGWVLVPDWQQDQHVVDFLHKKGYTLLTTKPVGSR